MLRAPVNPIVDPAGPPLPWPEGGSPRGDDAFREWVDATAVDWRRWAGAADPDGQFIPTWRLHGHLYKHFGGPLMDDGRAPIWRYRIRWLAVAFRRDPGAFDREARRYLLEQFHAHRRPAKR